MKQTLVVLALATFCGAASAEPHETQNYPGPYGTYFDNTNPNNAVLSATFTGAGYTPVGLRLVMDLTSVTEFTYAQDVTVTCTPPVGPAFSLSMSNEGAYTSLTDVTRIVALPAGVDPVGTWSFRLWDIFQDGDGSTPESQVSNIRLALEALSAPSAVELGALTPGVHVAGDNLEAAGVSWFKFVLPAANDVGAPLYVDLTTDGSNFDSVMALYDDGGRIKGVDDEDGLDAASFLSFGYGGGTTTGDDEDANPTVSDGRDGTLPGGTYYLAIIDFGAADWAFANIWTVTPSPAGAAGTVTLVIRIGASPAPGGTPPAAVDVGTIGAGVITTNVAVGTAGAVQWLKFALAGPASDASQRYLDIDTTGSSLGTLNDTELALYTSGGLRAATDDDEGTGYQSALSFGASTPARPPIGFGAAGNGRDGPLPAGDYYLACAEFNAAFTQGFGATTNGVSVGTIAVNFRSNDPSICSAADIGVQGGVPGRDNLLDNNDFIVYIADFFASAPSADLGIQGGVPGQDGVWDNNDFIVFIGIFFTDQPNCQG